MHVGGKSKQASNNHNLSTNIVSNLTEHFIYLNTQIYLNNNPHHWDRMGYFIAKLHLDIRYLFPVEEVECYFPVTAIILAIFFTTWHCCS